MYSANINQQPTLSIIFHVEKLKKKLMALGSALFFYLLKIHLAIWHFQLKHEIILC
jgi:hypothetical protein